MSMEPLNLTEPVRAQVDEQVAAQVYEQVEADLKAMGF